MACILSLLLHETTSMFCPKERDSDCFHVRGLAAPACIDLLKDLLEKKKQQNKTKKQRKLSQKDTNRKSSREIFFLLAMNLILTHFH